MTAAAIIWAVAIIFFTSGLEKLVSPTLRQRFLDAWEQFLPAGGAGWQRPLAIVFILAEAAVLPLLFFVPVAAQRLLLALVVAVTFYALIQWHRGALAGECPCGGLWAASGRNLLLRNGLLAALTVYAFLFAPVPFLTGALWYALGALLLLLFLAGFSEAVRVRLRTR